MWEKGMMTGEFSTSLDEKNRLLFPYKLRVEITGTRLMATKGPDNCLWLFLPDAWKEFSEKVFKSLSPFDLGDREVYRRIIGPAQELEIDKIGRILVPSSLKEYARLKKEIVILGVKQFIEIWDEETLKAHSQENDGVYKEAEKKLIERVSF